jgi:hypothetical protein
MEIHTAKSSPFEAGIAVENLKIWVLPGIDQIQVGLIQAGAETLKDISYSTNVS